jgi:type II secretory pathway pseudopilin PulG
MFTAIIGAVAAIGAGVMGMISGNRQSKAVENSAALQYEATKAMADANKYVADTGLLGTQFDGLLSNEQTKNWYAGLQAGILVLAIVVVGIIALIKKSK